MKTDTITITPVPANDVAELAEANAKAFQSYFDTDDAQSLLLSASDNLTSANVDDVFVEAERNKRSVLEELMDKRDDSLGAAQDIQAVIEGCIDSFGGREQLAASLNAVIAKDSAEARRIFKACVDAVSASEKKLSDDFLVNLARLGVPLRYSGFAINTYRRLPLVVRDLA